MYIDHFLKAQVSSLDKNDDVELIELDSVGQAQTSKFGKLNHAYFSTLKHPYFLHANIHIFHTLHILQIRMIAHGRLVAKMQ